MYEVYALKYGERDTKTCQFFYRDDKHDPLTLHYFVWLILGGPHPVLVDTGFLEDDAEARGIRNYVRPSTVVEKVAGVKANAIPMALISHLPFLLSSAYLLSAGRDSGWGGANNIGAVTRLRPLADKLPAGIAEARAAKN